MAAFELDHHGCSSCCDLEALSLLMRHQQELLTQLRALVLPSLVKGGGWSSSSSSSTAELAVRLFDDVIGCNTSVVSRLQLAAVGSFLSGCGPAGDGEIVVDDKSLDRKSIAPASEKMVEAKPISKKRRRNGGDKRSRSVVTNIPDYDGHQWRKYGQKKINGTQHLRSYYRCAYRERNCSATKTVQKQDHHQNGSSNFIYGEREVDTAKYNVVYYGDHTCMGGDSMISNANTNVDLHHHDQSSGGGGEETAARRTPEMFQGFDEGDLDVPALLGVLDNSLLNWETMWSYYRCTYKQDLGCKATKTVQQQDGSGGGGSSCLDDSAMYSVVYYGQHTCKPGDADSGAAGAVETASTGTDSSGGDGELARSDNVSVTCTSVIVVDGHHRTSAPSSTSLEISNSTQLLDMAEEYLMTTADQVNNKNNDMFDVVASAPLDFGAVWDWALDASGGDYYWYY